MTKQEQVEKLTRYMANFVSHIGKKLPDDIIAKLDELAQKEDSPLSKTIYETMKRNQELAVKLPGYRSTAVLGKMRNTVSADGRAGRPFKGCSDYLHKRSPFAS